MNSILWGFMLHCNTAQNKTNINTKPLEGKTLQTKHLWPVRYKLYPPQGTEHYELLELHQYNIGMHRGSFLLGEK